MRPASNDTFVRVLYRLRAEIIREGQEGLEHVEALLRLRGADPEAQRVPPKAARHFGRGELRLAILRALRDGPRTGMQIAEAIAAEHGIASDLAYKRVAPTLWHLRAQGVVTSARKDNRGRLLWDLAL